MYQRFAQYKIHECTMNVKLSSFNNENDNTLFSLLQIV